MVVAYPSPCSWLLTGLPARRLATLPPPSSLSCPCSLCLDSFLSALSSGLPLSFWFINIESHPFTIGPVPLLLDSIPLQMKCVLFNHWMLSFTVESPHCIRFFSPCDCHPALLWSPHDFGYKTLKLHNRHMRKFLNKGYIYLPLPPKPKLHFFKACAVTLASPCLRCTHSLCTDVMKQQSGKHVQITL